MYAEVSCTAHQYKIMFSVALMRAARRVKTGGHTASRVRTNSPTSIVIFFFWGTVSFTILIVFVYNQVGCGGLVEGGD
jgi:hypothetical protein